MSSQASLSRASSAELSVLDSAPSSQTTIIPTKRPRTGWVWNHMPDDDCEAIYQDKEDNILWRCQHCTRQYKVSGGTRIIMNHLRQRHDIHEYTTREARALNQQISIQQAMSIAQENPYKRRRLNDDSGSSLDPDQLEVLYVKWVTACSVSFRMVECPEFRALFSYVNKDIDTWLPNSHNTIKEWVLRRFEDQKVKVKQSLNSSRTQIHISCDLWSSPNSLSILGIIAHYITDKGQLRSSVLALKEVDGEHSGENLSLVILQVVDDYEIQSQLGYFVMDNASNNDKMMQYLSISMCSNNTLH
jgi:hypothetical protein